MRTSSAVIANMDQRKFKGASSQYVLIWRLNARQPIRNAWLGGAHFGTFEVYNVANSKIIEKLNYLCN